MFVEHKEVGEVAEAPAKITKPSQAIREGSKLRGECRSRWFTDGRSCAWTAAAEATGMELNVWLSGGAIYQHLKAHFPALTLTLFSEVVQRMDSYKWSRERCAGWLEAQGF